jgi:AraC-like DNA-binding protein
MTTIKEIPEVKKTLHLSPQSHNPIESQMKVWQPAEFGGLELERVHGLAKAPPPVFLITYSIQVAMSGYAKIRYGKTRQIVKITRPTVLLQNPGEIWAYETIDDTPIIVKNFDIPVEVYTHLLNRVVPFDFSNLLLANDGVNNYLAHLTLKAFSAFEHPTSRLEKDTHLIHLLTETLKHCATTSRKKSLLGDEHRAIGIVKEALHTSLEINFFLAELAILTNLNKHYLLNTFKRDVGVSPHAYQTHLRINKAQNLLSKGLTIAQVALDTGFSDQSHLTHVFRKYKRVTPGQYQKDSLTR